MVNELLTRIAKKMHLKTNGNIAIKDSNGGLKKLRKLTDELSRCDPNAIEINNLESWYRNIIQNYNDMIMLTKPDGIIAYVSPNCIDVLGWDAIDLINVNTNPNIIDSIIHKDDANTVRKNYLDSLKGDCGKDNRYRVVTKKHKIHTISHTWTPLFVSDELYLIISIIKRVDEQF